MGREGASVGPPSRKGLKGQDPSSAIGAKIGCNSSALGPAIGCIPSFLPSFNVQTAGTVEQHHESRHVAKRIHPLAYQEPS